MKNNKQKAPDRQKNFGHWLSILNRMIKRVDLLLILGVVISGCSLLSGKAGVEIVSYPSAVVYIDGKEMGSTPFKSNVLKPGEIEVRLVSNIGEWTRKVHLENNANTVVNWDFGADNGNQGNGYVLYLEPTGDQSKSGLLVNSIPDKASVKIDNEVKALTPARIEDLGEGDKQVVVAYPSYKNVIVFVKAIKGYQLVLETELAKEETASTTLDQIVSVTPTLAATTSANMVKVKIKETGTGWLRVRGEANSSATELGKVNTGESFALLKEILDWDLIKLSDGTSGWVSAKYVAKD